MNSERILRAAALWFDRSTVEGTIEPLVADWQRECLALSRAARVWCHVRAGVAMVITLAVLFAADIWRPSPVALRKRLWASFAVFVSAGTLLLLIPFALRYQVWQWSPPFYLLLPSALVIAIPVAIVPVIILLLGNTQSHPAAARRAAVRVTGMLTVATIVLGGWGSPLANDAWRRAVAANMGYHYPPARGERELTLTELARREPPPDFRNAPLRERELQTRLTIVASPVVLAVLAFAAARRRRTGWVASTLWWITTPLLWFFLSAGVQVAIRSGSAPPTSLWLVPGSILLIAALISRLGMEQPAHRVH